MGIYPSTPTSPPNTLLLGIGTTKKLPLPSQPPIFDLVSKLQHFSGTKIKGRGHDSETCLPEHRSDQT